MNTDLFIYDTQRLNSFASGETLQDGLAYCSECRISALNLHNHVLNAQLHDNATNSIYEVELTQNSEGNLVVQCSCHHKNRLCQHAFAVLHFYNASVEHHQKQVEQAAHNVIQQCIKTGQNHIRTKLISGTISFGIWQALPEIPPKIASDAYQVHIRSLHHRLNYCTCPDLNGHRLGTCQHIEAVLHAIQSKPNYSVFSQTEPPVSFTYLTWQNNQPVIRLYAISTANAALKTLCSYFFDADQNFIGDIPGDFFRFIEQVTDRNDCHIGEDTLHYAKTCLKRDAQAMLTEQTQQSILQSNGELPSMKVRLPPFQLEGTAFLASRQRALLADDIGLGKTLQAIAAATWLLQQKNADKILVLSPTSLKYHWAQEIKKFSTYKVQIIQGNLEQRALQYQSDSQFFIVTYETMVRDLSVIKGQLQPDVLILDEPQRNQHWRGRIMPKVQTLPCNTVFILSTLILELRLEDLYDLLHLIDPCLLQPAWRYLLDYQISNEEGYVIGQCNLSALRDRVAPVVLKRQRHQVSAQLPDKTEVCLHIPLDKKQRGLHDTAMTHAKQLAQAAKHRTLTPGEQHRLMANLQQARMACNAAGLIDKTTQGSPKLHELSYLLAELCVQGQQKTVIFSQWAVMTEMIETLVIDMGLACVRLHGELNNTQRTQLTQRFQTDNTLQVMISTDASVMATNLYSATVLIHFDMPWNPSILDQRLARVDKFGQNKALQIFSLLAEDAYEQQITRWIKSKRELFDNAANPETNEDTTAGLSKKMLQSLIEALIDNVANSDKLSSNPESATSLSPSTRSVDNVEEGPHIRQLIEQIQCVFKYRIQHILGSLQGVLVIVNPLNNNDEDSARLLSKQGIPVAVIDHKTLASLTRLAKFSDLSDMAVLYESNPQTTINPLVQLAKAKLHSAEMLLTQQCTAGVLDLLASALALQVAAIAGQFQAPTLDTFAVWLQDEILPQQLLSQEQAATIIGILALQQSHNVPVGLIKQAVADAKLLCFPLGLAYQALYQ